MNEDDFVIVDKEYLAELEYNNQFMEILLELDIADWEGWEEALELRESRLH